MNYSGYRKNKINVLCICTGRDRYEITNIIVWLDGKSHIHHSLSPTEVQYSINRPIKHVDIMIRGKCVLAYHTGYINVRTSKHCK